MENYSYATMAFVLCSLCGKAILNADLCAFNTAMTTAATHLGTRATTDTDRERGRQRERERETGKARATGICLLIKAAVQGWQTALDWQSGNRSELLKCCS